MDLTSTTEEEDNELQDDEDDYPSSMAMDALDDCLDDIANSQDNGGVLAYSPTAKATPGLIHSCNGDDLDGSDLYSAPASAPAPAPAPVPTGAFPYNP